LRDRSRSDTRRARGQVQCLLKGSLMTRLTAMEVMTEDVLIVAEDWPLDRLAEFFVEHRISGAPVASEVGRLVGVVSATDLAREPRWRSEQHECYLSRLDHRYAEEELAELRVIGNTGSTVADIMTPTIFTVGQDASMQQIADTMVRGRIHRVFVESEEGIVGVISALDLMRVLRDS
jgi:CBS domain-containing protein